LTRRSGPGDRWPPSKARIRALIKQALVDAYGEEEQRTGFLTMLEEYLAVPFHAEYSAFPSRSSKSSSRTMRKSSRSAAGAVAADESRFSTCHCRDQVPAGAEWIEAYRAWARAR